MIDNKQLRECIIKPTLDSLQMYSQAAEELLVFTCACESLGGTYLKQVKGPALGIYQMEPATYQDIWENYKTGVFAHPLEHLISTLTGFFVGVFVCLIFAIAL